MASTIFLSFPIGPLVGGVLLDHFWWGSVFLINVPVVVVALVAVAILMPESRSAERPRVDFAGVAISSAGLITLTYGCIGRPGRLERSRDHGHDRRGGPAGQLRRLGAHADQARKQGVRPLVELSLFRSAGFTWGTILATLMSFATFGIMSRHAAVLAGGTRTNALGSQPADAAMISEILAGMIGGTRLQSPRRPAIGPAGQRPGTRLGLRPGPRPVLPGRRWPGPGPWSRPVSR